MRRIKAVADKGGVVGVYFMPFLTLDSHPKRRRTCSAHVEHVANFAGGNMSASAPINGVLPTTLDAETKEKLKKWQLDRIKGGDRGAGRRVGVYPWSRSITASTATSGSPAILPSAAGARARLES